MYMYLHIYICVCISVYEMVGLVSQFATPNCLGWYFVLNLGRKISRRSYYSSPSNKIKNTIYFEYYLIVAFFVFVLITLFRLLLIVGFVYCKFSVPSIVVRMAKF